MTYADLKDLKPTAFKRIYNFELKEKPGLLQEVCCVDERANERKMGKAKFL